MTTHLSADRLRSFIDLILSTLDRPADGAAIAGAAFVSRYHFERLMSAALGESPVAFRRRLLLERAAWRLISSPTSVTDAAIEADYESVEGFERAFARTFGLTPSTYRESQSGFRAPAPNGIHFHPPSGVFVPGPTKGDAHMDVTERLLEHDRWLTKRLLDRAGKLPPEELDRTIWDGLDRLPFDPAEPTVRSMLSRLVWTKENWVAAVAGRPPPVSDDTSIEGLRSRSERAGAEFAKLVQDIRDRGDWDSGFVDALCDPPESFTFGGMIAHVVTFQAYRRQVLLKALRKLGVDDLGIGDPVEWERSLA